MVSCQESPPLDPPSFAIHHPPFSKPLELPKQRRWLGAKGRRIPNAPFHVVLVVVLDPSPPFINVV